MDRLYTICGRRGHADETVAPCVSGKIGSTPGEPIRWSPAGDWIASGIAPSELRITSPDGKTQRVLRKPGYGAWSFNASGDRIFGLRRDEERRWAVWSIDPASGVERKLTTLDVSTRADLVGF